MRIVYPRPTTRRRSRTTVLVVDDDAEVLAVTTDMLKQLGYRVTGASSGQEALERLSEMGARPSWWSSTMPCRE